MKQPPPPQARTTLTHNFTGSNTLVIPAASTYDYILTGTYNAAGHGVTVGLGYKGTITLNNVAIYTTTAAGCPILLQGGVGNLPTQTDVILELVGTSRLVFANGVSLNYSTDTNYAALTIFAGTRCTIQGDGRLEARISTTDNDAEVPGASPGIGASLRGYDYSNSVYGKDTLIGGDLIIKSSAILAYGSVHAAGIGGGFTNMRSIIITGGDIQSHGGQHGSGIGGGCYGTSGTLVVLPPTKINCTGKGGSSAYAVGDSFYDVGITIFYMGDPSLKKLRVSAQPLGGIATTGRKNVNVLFDVSGDSTIAAALRLANLDPTRWYAGTTGEQGYWETTGKIAGNVKVYSDTPTPAGQVYSSKKVSVPGTADVHIIIDDPDMSTPWLQVTQNVTNWTNGSVVLTAKFNPAVTNLARIRQQGGTWQSVPSITKTVTSNGTHYFEAENEDGNTMTISHTVTNIDKGTPTINVS